MPSLDTPHSVPNVDSTGGILLLGHAVSMKDAYKNREQRQQLKQHFALLINKVIHA